MTTYKKPVFFDRDIKAFSELSEDAGLDLGIVARSILADAALQVGTTDSAGTILVKNASDAATINLSGEYALATIGGPAAGTVSVKNASDAETINLSGEYAQATIGGPVAGTVSVKNASDVETIKLDGANGQVYVGQGGAANAMLRVQNAAGTDKVQLYGTGLVMLNDQSGAETRVRLNDGDVAIGVSNADGIETMSFNGATATVTIGGPAAGTVSVRDASNAEVFNVDASLARVTVGGSTEPGHLRLKTYSDNDGIIMSGSQGQIRLVNASNLQRFDLNAQGGYIEALDSSFRIKNSATNENTIQFNGGNAYIGAPGNPGYLSVGDDSGQEFAILDADSRTVSVKNASNAETIRLDGSLAKVSVGASTGFGGISLNGQSTQVISGNQDGTGAFTKMQSDGFTTWGTSGQYLGYFGGGTMWLNGADENNRVYLSTNGAGGGYLDLYDSSATGVATINLDGATGSITLSGAASKITGLATAEITQPLDAANKAYVDSLAQGLAVKGACHVSSQGNIADLSTTTQVDGHTLGLNERVLVRYQTNAVENGIYRFDGTGLVRADDFAVGLHVAGAFTFVQFGTNADQGWVCTADNAADVVGTDSLPWSQFSAAGVIEPGNGLQLVGTVMSVKLDGSTIAASVDGIKTLGLPSLFTIDGTATSANVTATNLNDLTAGRNSDVSSLHGHASDFVWMSAAAGLAVGEAAIVSGTYEADTAGTTTEGARVLGVVENITSGSARIVRSGFAANVLTGATAGAPYYVQADGTLGTALPTSGRVIYMGVAVSNIDLFVQIRDLGTVV